MKLGLGFVRRLHSPRPPLSLSLISHSSPRFRSATMAVRGVWQLQKLIVCFCDHSGSSAGARDFVARLFPFFQKLNPQVEVTTNLVRGHHPHLRGLYVNKNERVVDVKNQNAEEIMTQVMRLRNSTGRKVVKLKTRHVTFNPSIQGSWTPELKV